MSRRTREDEERARQAVIDVVNSIFGALDYDEEGYTVRSPHVEFHYGTATGQQLLCGETILVVRGHDCADVRDAPPGPAACVVGCRCAARSGGEKVLIPPDKKEKGKTA